MIFFYRFTRKKEAKDLKDKKYYDQFIEVQRVLAEEKKTCSRTKKLNKNY